MKRLHYFNPENDIVLGLDVASYTPTPAVSRFKRAGSVLPLWFGEDGDRCLSEGFEARWFNEIKTAFHLGTDIYVRGEQREFAASPWGWSKAARKRFESEGLTAETLPDDATLQKLRELSHRRTAMKLHRLLSERLSFPIAPPAVEIDNEDAIRKFARDNDSMIFKQPWSSSGRGIIPCAANNIERTLPMLGGIIRRQGSVMGEVRHSVVLDFAMLFTAERGKVAYKGLSLFFNDDGGNYRGNIIAPQSVLERRICTLFPATQFAELRRELPCALQEILGNVYTGPLGVDMMLTENNYGIAPAIEINLRRTMGHVAMDFHRLHAHSEFTGTYSIEARESECGTGQCHICDGRLEEGRLNLAAPYSGYSFVVESSLI